MIENEDQLPLIGYGGMLTESFVAIMAMIGATVIHPGVYFAMNSPAGLIGTDAASAASVISNWGFVVSPDTITQLAQDVGEKTLLSRTGGAPTLAVGMATILSSLTGMFGQAMMGIWYHFAILFEALFILTTVDAGTRVARFMIQDMIGSVVPSFRQTEFLVQQCCWVRACDCGVGLFPLSGRDRPLRRDLHALAAVRHLQPDVQPASLLSRAASSSSK